MAIDAADLLALMRARRSHKMPFLKPDPVDPSLIEQVLEAARWAPSHGKTEPWHFTVFTGEGRRALGEAFGEAYRIQAEARGNFTQEAFETSRDKVWKVPVWIALTLKPGLKPDGSFAMPEWEELLAFGGAVQNLHLAATALGLAGQWSTGAQAVLPHVAEFVGVPAPSRPLGFFILGHPGSVPPDVVRRPLDDKVTWRG